MISVAMLCQLCRVLMLKLVCCTSSLETGKIMHICSMAFASLIAWNSSFDGSASYR
jgi:hypothetical protein